MIFLGSAQSSTISERANAQRDELDLNYHFVYYTRSKVDEPRPDTPTEDLTDGDLLSENNVISENRSSNYIFKKKTQFIKCILKELLRKSSKKCDLCFSL